MGFFDAQLQTYTSFESRSCSKQACGFFIQKG